tara:strand:+ start:7413 stop:8213 length:801 start_codon:yes stop_codon:yes gene_type:complete
MAIHPIPAPNYVLTISGSDASGCSGVQTDNRAILSCGATPLNVISALTLQTSEGVESIEIVDAELVRLHVNRLLSAFPVGVIKVGMLGNASIVRVVAEALEYYPDVHLVLDPVVRATSRRPLLDAEGLEFLINELLPKSYLLTPNTEELAVLGQIDGIPSEIQEKLVVDQILSRGCRAVLVKGGHRKERTARDRLYFEDRIQDFSYQWIETENTRGSGCALASLIAGGLATGKNLLESVNSAKGAIDLALTEGKKRFWQGRGPAFF